MIKQTKDTCGKWPTMNETIVNDLQIFL